MHRGEEEITELVNLVIDGEATEQDSRKLDLLLRTSDDARTVFEQTRQVARRIDAMPIVDPPADLRAGVLRQIREMPVFSANAAPPLLFRPSARRLTLGVVWAAAASLVLLFVVNDPLHWTSRRSSEAVATMAPSGALQWPVVAEFPHLTVRHHGDLYSLEPRANQPGPLRVSVGWDPRTMAFVGVSGGTDVSSAETEVTLTLRPPERAAVIVRLVGRPSSAEVHISLGNQLFASRFVVPGMNGQQQAR